MGCPSVSVSLVLSPQVLHFGVNYQRDDKCPSQGSCIGRYMMIPCVVRGDDSGFRNADTEILGSSVICQSMRPGHKPRPPLLSRLNF